MTIRMVLAASIAAVSMVSAAEALTFKKGEVLGADGQMHVGASPENVANLIANAKADDKPAGVVGPNVFVLVGDTVTFVPVSDIAGKSKSAVIEIVGDRVVQNVTGSDSITFEQVKAVSDMSDGTDIEIDALLESGDLADIDPEMLAEIEEFSSASGISMDNLLAVNSVIDALPEGEINEFIGELGALIDEGFAEQVDSFLSELNNIEGGLNAIVQYESYEDCQSSGGGDVCDQVNALMEESDI